MSRTADYQSKGATDMFAIFAAFNYVRDWIKQVRVIAKAFRWREQQRRAELEERELHFSAIRSRHAQMRYGKN